MTNDIFDAVLSNTTAAPRGPQIIQQNHNQDEINIGPGAGRILSEEEQNAEIQRLITPGTGWDAGEMGMTLEAATAFVRAQNSPEAKARAVAELKARAQRRANLATVGDKIAYVGGGEAPWHELGITARGRDGGEQLTLRDLLELGNLHEMVLEKRPVYTINDAGEYVEIPSQRSVFRLDTQTPLDCAVGEGYEIVQVLENLEHVDRMLRDGNGHFDAVGIFGNGESMFASAVLPDWFELTRGDDVRSYLLLLDHYNGTGGHSTCHTTLRSVCQNTARIAAANGKSLYKNKHTKNIRQRMRQAERAIQAQREAFEAFKEKAEAMNRVEINPVAYVDSVLDQVLDITAASAKMGADALAATLQVTQAEREAEAKRFDRKIRKRGELLDAVLTVTANERNAGTYGNNLWAAYNGVTEYADHHLRYNDTGNQAQNRFRSIVEGRAQEIKEAAMVSAEALLS